MHGIHCHEVHAGGSAHYRPGDNRWASIGAGYDAAISHGQAHIAAREAEAAELPLVA